MLSFTAIDPEGCACTECLTGEYLPMEYMTRKHYRKVKSGKLRNHTGLTLNEIRRYLKAHYRWELRKIARGVVLTRGKQ